MVTAFHLERPIDLKQFRNKFDYPLLKREHSFLLYKLDETAYLYVKDYGSIVFFNASEEDIKEVFSILDVSILKSQQLPKESYIVSKGTAIEVDFGTIKVPEVTDDVAHIIMFHLAQSVALNNYVNATSALQESTMVYSKELEQKGKLNVSKKKMQMFIGKTMNLRNHISENLFIFDSSDLAWSKEELSILDYQLKDELDIVKRHQGLQFSLDVIKENLDLFKDILQHKHSSMLEWIIIFLILFEILQVIVEKIILS